MKRTNSISKGLFVILGLSGISAAGFSAAYFTMPARDNLRYVSTPTSQVALMTSEDTIVDTEASAVPLSVEETVVADEPSYPLTQAPESTPIAITHIETPEAVRAIYMSQCVVGTPSFRAKLADLIDRTELNAVVIDIRDYTGKIAFPTDNPMLADMVSDGCGARDMRAYIKSLHDRGIYVIGRITVFQNPVYVKLHPEQAVQKVDGGVWKDYKGLGFVDVGAKPYWETVVELSRVAYEEFGFDELNFDYVRFPSDGPMTQAVYTWSEGVTKAAALEEFFKYLHDELEPLGVPTSADLFGMVATNYDDLSIGQVLERALPYFDYISPMVYPSHYPAGWGGFDNPATHPYEVVHIAMTKAVERTEALGMDADKIRPWLQDFNMGATYTAELVRKQIEASYDAGLDSWYLWDAGNTYTEAALEKQ